MAYSYYTICGLVVESDAPINELKQHDPKPADLIVRWNPQAFPVHLSEPFREWRNEDRVYLSFRRTDRGYHLHFPKQGEFWISQEGTEILCRPEPGVYDAAFRHLLLDQAVPMALSRRGLTVLHASAVDLGSGAIAFAGKSGNGKSTLAAYFAQQGGNLVADDVLVIHAGGDAVRAVPSYPGVRLWRDSLDFLAPDNHDLPQVYASRDKRRYSPERWTSNADAGVKLARLYFLHPPPVETFAINPLMGTALMRQVVGSQILLDSEDPQQLQSCFQAALLLSKFGLCFSLAVPRDLRDLPDYSARIAEHAGAKLSC